MRNGVEALYIISTTGPGDAWPRNSRSCDPAAHHVRPGSAQSGETRGAGVESFGSSMEAGALSCSILSGLENEGWKRV